MLDSLTLSVSQRNSLEMATALYEEGRNRLASYLASRGIDREGASLLRLGFVSEASPGHERFVGMMSIPYLTPGGPMAIKFRNLDPDSTGPKYDGPSGQHARLYNVAALLDTTTDTAVICEGELDAAVCTTVVGVPAVGTPGTTWLEHWPRCFADYDQVLIVADNDIKADSSNPGLKHAKSVQSTLHRARIVIPPPGMDLGEWVQSAGADAVREGMGL